MNWLYRSAFSCFVRQCDEFSRRVLRMQHVCLTCRQSGAPCQCSGPAQGWERTPRCRDPVRCGTSRARAPCTGSGPAQGGGCAPPILQAVYDTAGPGPGAGGHEAPFSAPHSPSGRMRGNRARKRRAGQRYRHPAKRQEKNKSNQVYAPMRGGRAALPHGTRLAVRQAGLPRHAVVLRRQGIRP